MVINLILSQAIYPAIMLFIAVGSFLFNIHLAKKSNERFKQEQMDKKLDIDDFKEYKEDHEEIHNRDREDVLYIRSKVDEIAVYLRNNK